jgi:NAD(P)-dependent dehydrogenase (short-subunit alcohol dehydrogenase family)
MILEEIPRADIEVVVLDLDDEATISSAVQAARAWLRGGALTVLVNNAAYITYDWSLECLHQSMRTNYHGTIAVTEAFLPILDAEKGRVIFVSSAVGKAYLLPAEQQRLALAEDADMDTLESIMRELEGSVSRGTFRIPEPNVGGIAYGIGKLGGCTLYPRILARRLGEGCFVASCCPAFDRADTIVWLATAPDSPDFLASSGQFFEMRRVTDPVDFMASMKRA